MPFEQRYVGFVDILGFREIVAQAGADPGRYAKLLNTMMTIATQRHSLSGNGFQFSSFSDSIAVSAEVNDEGLWSVLLFCDALQFNLWAEGILFRGAITKGAMHHDSTVVFGPAFIEAYELETKTATHPRIMLSDPVYQDAVSSDPRMYPNYVDKHILTLPFDVPCIHPFSDWKHLLHTCPSMGLQRFVMAKAIIEQNLNIVINKPALVSKWAWLARVYNDLIRQSNILSAPGIGVIIY